MDHKALLRAILDNALRIEAIETAFAGCLVQKESDNVDVEALFLQSFKPFWTKLPAESRETILTEFLTYTHQQSSLRRVELCFGLLASLVAHSVILPRSVCEAVLKSEYLKFEDEVKWCKSFQILRIIIGGTDYKGCRDVLSLVFQKFNCIPKEPDPAYTDRIECAVKVVQYILDRKACLLPAYFVINEIYKDFPEGQVNPHWSLSKILSDYVDSFRPLAHMVTVTGRSSLLPIIGHPGSSIGVWKLDPATLSFPLKGLLPYDKISYERKRLRQGLRRDRAVLCPYRVSDIIATKQCHSRQGSVL